jgi:dTDP-4-dehydrorhamnose reductase
MGKEDILYTGASSTSLVGSRVAEVLPGNTPSHAELDILNPDTFEKFNPKVLVHFAAATNVNACETNPDNARQLNVVGTENLVDYFGRRGVKVIYISTDYVFDGTAGPYDENAIPNPINVYGRTKLEGEEEVLSHCDNATVVRIAFPYRLSGPKSDTLRWMITSIMEGKEIPVFDNLRANFTFIDDIARALKILIDQDFKGVIHVTGDEIYTVYEVAMTVVDILGENFAKYVKPKHFEVSDGVASRPLNGGLISRYRSSLGIKMTPLEENIRRIIESQR